MANKGFRLLDFDISLSSGKRYFSGIFDKGDEPWSYFVLVWDHFYLKNKELHTKYSQYLVDFEVYQENGANWYAGVWREGSTPQILSLAPAEWPAFNKMVSDNSKKGFILKKMRVIVQNGKDKVIGLWEKDENLGYYHWVADWNSFSDFWLKRKKEGWKLTDYTTYKSANGSTLYAGIWRPGKEDTELIEASDSKQFSYKIQKQTAKGMKLTLIRHESDGQRPPPGLAAIFHKHLDGQVMGYSYAVAEKGQVTSMGAYGYARSKRERSKAGIRMSPKTLIDIASTTKTITATALMHFISSKIPQTSRDYEGALSAEIDKKLVDVLKGEFTKVGTNAGSITLRHLLNHRSFLPQIDCRSDYKAQVRKAVATNLSMAPGTGNPQYNNLNFCVLRWVVEKLSGLSFESYLNDVMFAPVGVSMRCNPYTGQDRVLYYKVGDLSRTGYLGETQQSLFPVCGAGGLQASAYSGINYFSGFSNSKIVNEKTKNFMLSKQLGWWRIPMSFGDAYGHNGGIGQNSLGQGDATGVLLLPNDVQAVLYVNSAGERSNGEGLDAAYVLQLGFENIYSQ